MNCVFCKIAAGEIPSYKIFEDGSVLAFLDISPSSEGHTLVIPKKHYETLADIPVVELGELMAIVKRFAPAIMKATSSEGYNVFANNFKAAGQEVPHLHFHIVPRKEGDGIRFDWPHGKVDSQEAGVLIGKIKTLLNG